MFSWPSALLQVERQCFITCCYVLNQIGDHRKATLDQHLEGLEIFKLLLSKDKKYRIKVRIKIVFLKIYLLA